MKTPLPVFFLLAAVSVARLVSGKEAQRFGKPLEGLPATSLREVMSKPEAGKLVRLEGTIDAVCQNKGCWIALKQGGDSVHVTFEGYSFFLPKDSAGRKAALEGRIVVRDPDPRQVEHLEAEGAGPAARRRVSIEARGVEVYK